MAALAIVIVNYGTPDLVERLLISLQEHPDAALVDEVVVVDNGFPARGDVRTAIRATDYVFPLRFVQNSRASYSSGANRGATTSTAPFVAISNSDIEWRPEGGIAPLLDAMHREPDLGITGPQLLYPDGSWQRSSGSFPSIAERLRAMLFLEVLGGARAAWSHQRGTDTGQRPVDYVDGAFMVIRRSCFDQLGGFDERFSFYGEDLDFCWRAARAGWRRASVPTARLAHLRGASSRLIDSSPYIERLVEARQAFVARHFGERHAQWFIRLERVVSWEAAVLYRLLGTFLRTPAWKNRARLARLRAQAARTISRRPAPDTAPRSRAQ